ncbi:hypothetical protein SARC_13658 [Sphaeroforma arctica JP610]|uniref:diacylglycerol O-acyltransferase n=1 Tax=Sphaeroforma arctica JP610 TaxID=667725 RepID=A0A0L0FAL3_9EUKA|nr:hypothetical protein SARC_13658 [Sphaeroforma arctica JP610]KNC73785.1 hypothetical protein SARC_13658 [Sphaeroforma arctica JP610]|eukprot:XP_014147687.1 hypothetical protein SARC_13658 [Sphaeroforma arctica JP610]
MMKTVGFTLPMFHGRGFFQYNFGLTPMRKPLVTIVGKPIELPKLDNPTQDDVDKYHQEYIDALKDIYNRWKQDLAPDRKSSMNIVA